MTERVYERAVELMEAELGDEIVALEPAGGHCFGFNGVAASVWRLLAEPRAFADLQAALVEEFEVDRETCAAELKELLETLESEGLVRGTCRIKHTNLET